MCSKIQIVHRYPLICGDFIKDLAPLWMSKAHAYQLCFAWSSSNLLLKRLLRPRDSFHIFHTDNNGWKLDTQSILTSATSFQSPFFVHTFQYNLNAEPSTISSALPSRPSKKFRVMQFSALYLFRYHTCSINNPCLNTDLSTLFQSPFFMHTFQYALNAKPSTISFTLPSRPSKMFKFVHFQFSFLTCLV